MASLVEFKNSLKSLRISKSHISLLTKKADTLIIHAHAVVDAIIEYMDKVEVMKKMPSLYLLDSIVKNVGSPYTDIIKLHVTDIFCRIFKQGDKNIRKMLFDVRRGWNERFPPNLLTTLDQRVRVMDPAWPVFQKSCQESCPLTPTGSSSPAPSTVTGSPQDNSMDRPFMLVYVGHKSPSWPRSWPRSPNIESWIPRLAPPPEYDASASCPTPGSTPPNENFIMEALKPSSGEVSQSGVSSDFSDSNTDRVRRNRKRCREGSESLQSKRQRKTVS